MSTRRVAAERGLLRPRRPRAAVLSPLLPRSRAGRGPRLRAAALALLVLVAPGVQAQAPARPGASDDQVIVQVRSNGVERGEFTLLRKADGDIWIPAGDLTKLQIQPREQARREQDGESWYSSRALGASKVEFNEAELTLDIDFRADALRGTRIDLANRAPPATRSEPRNSLVLSYRLSVERPSGGQMEAALDNDLNLRVDGILLRQETRMLTTAKGGHFKRGATQVIYDDVPNARRFTAGDVFSTAGAYGSGITGAGLLLQKVYELTPDVVRQPTATLQASTTLPADVEVAVDGTPVYRTHVAPGPIVLNNLLLNGGTRNLRVTVTDASGRREVIEQPFLFTDAVLAKGFHEYSYFVGKRSQLDDDSNWKYMEPAWQGFHRYGVTDHLTVAAGGEGNADFHNVGGGVTLRSDRLGLLSVDLLSSTDRKAQTHAGGWSTRYTYLSTLGTAVLARREFGDGFRSFATTSDLLFPRSETRVGLSTAFGRMGISADLVRTVTATERRDARFLRFSTFLSRTVSLFAEYQTTRVNGVPGWSASVFVRADLDPQHWVSAGVKTAPDGRTAELQTGKQLPQGEGFGYRASVLSDVGSGQGASTATVAADWHLRPATLGLFAVTPVRGNGGTFLQGTASGAVVGLDGYWGLTREVNDAFALVKLGVPQAGVEVLLNNQSQGRTDAQGRLFIPELSSLGRQDITINDKDLDMQYNLSVKRRTIVPVFRSGNVVDFGIHKMRALAGMAQIVRGGESRPVAARAWTMEGPAGTLQLETSMNGEFYLEDAPPGRYSGRLRDATGQTYTCRMTVPDFPEAVHELKEGVLCD